MDTPPNFQSLLQESLLSTSIKELFKERFARPITPPHIHMSTFDYYTKFQIIFLLQLTGLLYTYPHEHRHTTLCIQDLVAKTYFYNPKLIGVLLRQRRHMPSTGIFLSRCSPFSFKQSSSERFQR